MSSPASGAVEIENKGFITASIMLAAMLQSIDTTIANVALPHIQGSLSASQDQITWVLTSYIVAAAIMTPLTSWMAARFGVKPVFLASVLGFTLASALCGAAQTLPEIVGFRLLQGVAGAALTPLTQAVLFSINPPHKYGQAMGTFGLAIVIGPILGPVMGGWLTDNLSWRWVFFINVPLGALCLFGLFTFLPSRPRGTPPRFDFFGFISLGLAIGALQLMLDRGLQNDWFQSTETWAELGVFVVMAYLFLVHFLTAERPFFSRALFADGNFLAGTVAIFFIMGVLFASLALVPPMLQSLYGYPVITTGLITMPRGLGTMVMMPLVGRLVGRVDPRLLLGTGLAVTAHSFWAMSRFTLHMDYWPFVGTGIEQGMGLAFVFVPLSAIAFATINAKLRVEGTTFYNLSRNIGSSLGISVIISMLVQKIQVMHGSLVANVRADNPLLLPFGGPEVAHSSEALSRLNGMATQQATMVSYNNAFWLMAIVTAAIIPGLFFMRKPARAPVGPPALAAAD